MAPARPVDPWGQEDDLEGTALYNTLGLEPKCSTADIKKAYRLLAKQHHPDKGGDPAAFARLQAAFEVLIDPVRRQVYDTWAKELQFRYVRTAAAAGGAGMGGEGILLDGFENMGLHCDPATQLVVTCEVCRRPATKECWTCGMQICEFCTLKRHWKDSFPLHWPLVNSEHMKDKLGQRELEKKKVEDANRLQLEDPNFRTEAELQEVRAFKEAAQALLKREDRKTAYDLRLARYYMWAQTSATVFLACLVPTGYEDRELVIECQGRELLVQSEDSPPLIERWLDQAVDTSRPIETFMTKDKRVCVMALPKGEPGVQWKRLFVGDSDGARCLVPPYTMSHTESDVLLEVELPFWIDPEDVNVRFTEHELVASVRNTLNLRRTYWRNRSDEERRRDYTVVQVPECLWSLEEDTNAAGERCKLLMMTLARPDPTEEEVQWKKGKRQDNRTVTRPNAGYKKGVRFFSDDEDSFELEDILQAMCVLEAGCTYVPAKPWDLSEESKWVADPRLLSKQVQKFILNFSSQSAAAKDATQPHSENTA
ncbi:hypothetical protein D9Q98_006066 [Chlorella vulgaris]|uniref:J domain-containing protein n=1 Tax=Chlorella vulgaris TaxID=3077 RepID=A0A9D4Z0X6_CHLVU|nr:hypothetical protein D9Q98_006066 [Chlorella vulgaris]